VQIAKSLLQFWLLLTKMKTLLTIILSLAILIIGGLFFAPERLRGQAQAVFGAFGSSAERIVETIAGKIPGLPKKVADEAGLVKKDAEKAIKPSASRERAFRGLEQNISKLNDVSLTATQRTALIAESKEFLAELRVSEKPGPITSLIQAVAGKSCEP
jgi:hypothetical protein